MVPVQLNRPGRAAYSTVGMESGACHRDFPF